MWKLSIEDDEGNKTVVGLVRDEYTIGRAEENSVRLTERNISRRHARLRRTDDGWRFSDESSYNGCFVNGVRIAAEQILTHGDLVQLGDYKLVILDEARLGGGLQEDSPAQVGSSARPAIDQPDRLVMLVGPTPGVEFPLVGARIIVGRGEDCDIALNHSSVSRIHAEIQALHDRRYEIIDRASANGVRVNGVELARALLDARDTIELGDVVLKYIPAGDIYRIERDESRKLNALTSADGRGVSAAATHQPLRQASWASRTALTIGGLAAVAVAGIALGLSSSPPTRSEAVQGAVSQGRDHAAKILGQATKLLDQGQVWRAHERAASLPPDSNARQTGKFRRIEAAWADAMFERAKNEADPDAAKAVLDEIARTPSVDSLRRKRAAEEIAKFDAEAVDVAELPRSPSTPPATQPFSTTHPPTPTTSQAVARTTNTDSAVSRAKAREAETGQRTPQPALGPRPPDKR